MDEIWINLSNKTISKWFCYMYISSCNFCATMFNLIFSQSSQIFGEQCKESYSPKKLNILSDTLWFLAELCYAWDGWGLLYVSDSQNFSMKRIRVMRNPSFYTWRNRFTESKSSISNPLFQAVEELGLPQQILGS